MRNKDVIETRPVRIDDDVRFARALSYISVLRPIFMRVEESFSNLDFTITGPSFMQEKVRDLDVLFRENPYL